MSPFIKVDTDILDSPAFAGLSAGALTLWLYMTAFCHRHATDGWFTSKDLRGQVGHFRLNRDDQEDGQRNAYQRLRRAANELIRRGIWEEESPAESFSSASTRLQSGFNSASDVTVRRLHIKGYLDQQQSSTEILKNREQSRLRQQAYRARRYGVTDEAVTLHSIEEKKRKTPSYLPQPQEPPDPMASRPMVWQCGDCHKVHCTMPRDAPRVCPGNYDLIEDKFL